MVYTNSKNISQDEGLSMQIENLSEHDGYINTNSRYILICHDGGINIPENCELIDGLIRCWHNAT